MVTTKFNMNKFINFSYRLRKIFQKNFGTGMFHKKSQNLKKSVTSRTVTLLSQNTTQSIANASKTEKR